MIVTDRDDDRTEVHCEHCGWRRIFSCILSTAEVIQLRCRCKPNP